MIEIIPYIITLMILYDVSIHFLYLIGKGEYLAKRKLNYWPVIYGIKYQIFWTTYWGIALILSLIYVFSI